MPLRPILFLLAAVAAEITGVTAMKLVADSESLASLLFMYAMIGLSFYLFSFAVISIPLGLAYALWEAAGMTAITFIGYYAFAESMNWYKACGILLLIAGVVIVKLAAPGDKDDKGDNGDKDAETDSGVTARERKNA